MTFKQRVKEFINNDLIFSKMEKYVKLIEDKNKVMNLTGFKDDVLWEEGIYESLIFMDRSFTKHINEKQNLVLDIGAGAGFPSVPYLIYNSNIKLTIYEPIQKRVDFLNLVSKELNLNIEVLKIRAEKSIEYEKFDFICARAVTDLKKLIEITNHLGKINSVFSFLKGPKVFQEWEEAKWIIDQLHIENIQNIKIDTKNLKENFTFSFVKKLKTKDGFPRKWENIVKK
ncbi:16S rRNA (guanine(527)-N(7))-methyltransferase RsmG [Mesomycoplasma lagogenitalium]|uniref:Ribosomal RNA small subunit methyltransferase G n=1 Tax=Mesomycoplasma lagogenitalium TaxID=171286 RepID=A0ABY8LTZ0_9BACT|nr:16S rRNA (guanine(527)-N(7))-methyltransferase RsmG [Mesomycoplasma lagogenitalium]WGI36704.1 16S rRNA (guanine(527)-N(7))-methyltransferase RsmG [Mesomycoplasma lagogenitalium]